MKTIAIVGATGAVGQQMIQCLEERNIACSLRLFASSRSKGKKFLFNDQWIECEVLEENSFANIDFILGATDNTVTKKWIPWAKKHKAIVIDNSSAYRLDPNVPLIIPEINSQDIEKHQGILANPNCATILGLMAIYPLHTLYSIQRILITTFQAVSGAGVQGIQDLEDQIRDPSTPSKAFDYPIAFNLIPQIGDFDDDGITKEEAKFQNEARKILHNKNLQIHCTCVRVPILRSHSLSILIECKKEVDVKEAQEAIRKAQGIQLKDDPQHKIYPMPFYTSNQDDVYVGRIRKDSSDPTGKSLSLFCCGDQIRKGAATNAVQILEKLI